MSLAHQIPESAEARIWAASYDARKEAFRVAMADGRIYLLKRPVPEDDGTDVLEVFLEGDGEVFTVIQTSGNAFSVPWDAIENLVKGSRHPGDPQIAKRIGQRIKALRTRKGLTQAQLARMLDLQRPNISRLETGAHVPSILLIQRVADALQVPVSDLIAGNG